MIRENPVKEEKKKEAPKEGKKPKRFHRVKMSKEQRADRVKQKKATFLKKKNESGDAAD